MGSNSKWVKPNKSHLHKQGFTLLEIIIAISVFSVIALGLMRLSVTTQHGIIQARTSTEASVLAARNLESIFSRKYEDGAIDNGSHTLTEGAYTINYEIRDDAILPNTKAVQLNISYNLGSKVKNVRYHYLLPQRVE